MLVAGSAQPCVATHLAEDVLQAVDERDQVLAQHNPRVAFSGRHGRAMQLQIRLRGVGDDSSDCSGNSGAKAPELCEGLLRSHTRMNMYETLTQVFCDHTDPCGIGIALQFYCSSSFQRKPFVHHGRGHWWCRRQREGLAARN